MTNENASAASGFQAQRKDWLMRVAVLTLLISVVNYGFAYIAYILSPSDNGITFYWPIIFYSYFFWPSFVLVPLSLVVIAFLLIRRARAGSIVISLCSSLCAFLMFSFSLVDGYQHIQSLKFNEQIYHLGRRVDIDGFSNYALCQCDQWGFACGCHYFYWIGWATINGQPQLLADSVLQSVDVQFEGKLIYKFSALPQCFNNFEIGHCLE